MCYIKGIAKAGVRAPALQAALLAETVTTNESPDHQSRFGAAFYITDDRRDDGRLKSSMWRMPASMTVCQTHS